jgi:hypothetical protein
MTYNTESQLSPKTKLYIVVAVFVILLSFGIFIYIRGKAAGKLAGSVNQSTPVIDNGNISLGSFVTNADIETLVQSVHDDMNGLNITGHSSDTWSKVLQLSDTDFIALNNEFNLKFQQSTGQDFKQWVQSEYSFSLNPFNPWPTIQNTILDRLAKLNIQ